MLIPATHWILASANIVVPTNSFAQWNSHADNTSHVFYLCSVLPVSDGNGGQRMRNQRQPFGVCIQFTPATDVCIPRQKKVDRTLELIDPVSSCGNGALVGVDDTVEPGGTMGSKVRSCLRMTPRL